MSSSPQGFSSERFKASGEIFYDPSGTGNPSPSIKEWAISCLLFILTFISVTFSGLFYVSEGIGLIDSTLYVLGHPAMLLYGLLYSVPLLSILLAHEMGHFMACRYYGLRCTPPYFIPIPISIAGTLGAFIKIKSPFRSKRALFDVGIAGPLAGFAVTLPILWIGISLSQIVPKTSESAGMIFFGEPLIFRIISAAIFNYNPNVEDLIAHPVAMAGWFGLLVTSLNLLPVWQLDGGHIAFALLGPRYQKKLSIAALSLLMLVGLYGWPTPSYLIFGLLVFILGYRQRFYHPSPIQSWDSIGKARIALALVSLAILILCFTPVPVSFN